MTTLLLVEDDKMLREDRESVDNQIVLASLSPFELDEMLIRGAMVRTQRTGPRRQRLGRHIRRRRTDAVGIALQHHVQPAELHLPHPDALQAAERSRHLRPDGQLVVNEFIYFLLSCHR